jgi:hypothetical protein
MKELNGAKAGKFWVRATVTELKGKKYSLLQELDL